MSSLKAKARRKYFDGNFQSESLAKTFHSNCEAALHLMRSIVHPFVVGHVVEKWASTDARVKAQLVEVSDLMIKSQWVPAGTPAEESDNMDGVRFPDNFQDIRNTLKMMDFVGQLISDMELSVDVLESLKKNDVKLENLLGVRSRIGPFGKCQGRCLK